MKTLLTYFFCGIFIGGCSNHKIAQETKKDSVPHILQGNWVINQRFNSAELLLLNQETYRPETPKYHYISFDHKRKTIKTSTAGEFGFTDGLSSKLDLRSLKWTLAGDTLHIYGGYDDDAGTHQFNSYYNVSHRGDTLCLKHKAM